MHILRLAEMASPAVTSQPANAWRWPARRIGTIAAAVVLGDKAAVDYAFDGMPDDEAESLTGAVRDFLLRRAEETGEWRTYAESFWILPHRWGDAALEFQKRIDAAVAAANVMSPKKRVQRVIARVAVDLVNDGVEADELSMRLRDYNATFFKPLSDGDVRGIAAWAQNAPRSIEPPAGHPASG